MLGRSALGRLQRARRLPAIPGIAAPIVCGRSRGVSVERRPTRLDVPASVGVIAVNVERSLITVHGLLIITGLLVDETQIEAVLRLLRRKLAGSTQMKNRFVDLPRPDQFRA